MLEIDFDFVKGILKKRPIDAYKNQFGHALIVAGSKGKIGAAVLSSKSCLKSGAGLTTVCCINGSAPIFHSSLPEVMVEEDSNNLYLTKIPFHERYSAYGIGPGIGTNDKTIDALESFLKNISASSVLDADAINVIAWRPNLKNYLKNKVLTPHIGECKRLIGDWENDNEAFEKIQSFVNETQSILVLKGAPTRIFISNGDFCINATGNPGMAKGGAGDVLTGVIVALLAQGYSSINAAQIGVFVHGLAGDLAVANSSNFSLLASDICDFLPDAFRYILGE
jgi:hydroxyethylthiazole kinase-like uncharacterized protein yjeF